MSSTGSTSWTLVEGAAHGDVEQRSRFVEVYTPVVRAYLQARWRDRAQRQELDDAVQEVFFACLRENGALASADRSRPNRFRAFLYGITRNTALKVEDRQRRDAAPRNGQRVDLDDLPGHDAPLSSIFDRAWARTILVDALDRQETIAAAAGDGAARRLELLRLRIHEDQPIRDIAAAWNEDAAHLHHEYARARREFLSALKATLADHASGPGSVTDEDVAELLSLLG